MTTICRIIQFVQNSCLDQASHRLIMFVEGINSTHLVCVLVIQIVSVVGDVLKTIIELLVRCFSV